MFSMLTFGGGRCAGRDSFRNPRLHSAIRLVRSRVAHFDVRQNNRRRDAQEVVG